VTNTLAYYNHCTGSVVYILCATYLHRGVYGSVTSAHSWILGNSDARQYQIPTPMDQ
jgi:hypothetical protein